jgi:hypothetical protein
LLRATKTGYSFIELIVLSRMTMNDVGAMLGRVMLKNWRQGPAPSSEAAS